MVGFIYQLCCANTKRPLYVGSTTYSLKERLWSHNTFVNDPENKNPLYEYIRTNNTKLEISLLEKVYVQDWLRLRRREKGWIRKFQKSGIQLFNRNYMKKEKFLSPLQKEKK